MAWGPQPSIIGRDPFLGQDGEDQFGVKFEDLKIDPPSRLVIHSTLWHCKGTINSIPVSARVVPKSATETTISKESAGFLRGRYDQSLPLVLQPMYRLDGGGAFYYVYHYFQYNLKTYLYKIKANPPDVYTTKLRRVIRGVFCALQDLHYRKKENHGNLNSEWCIVINEEPVFKVMLTGLGRSTDGDKKLECRALKNLLEAVIDGENLLWFRSMMQTLSDPYYNTKLWNLHNNILFLGAQQRLEYLSEAGKAVGDLDARPFMGKFSEEDSREHKWVHTVNTHSDYSPFFREILYHGQGDYSDEQYYTIVLLGKRSPRGFLWFCRNYASHDHESANLSIDDQWELLYRLWPEFFDRLHQLLVEAGIYVFRH